MDTYKLPNISIEQKKVLEIISEGSNVIVNSVAGSGKTTCILYIASYFRHLRILLLTYNAKLKIETREKAKMILVDNLEVHSYHSFCVKYYDKNVFNDTNLQKILTDKTTPLKSFYYDLIILDEAQDITHLYYELICKIYYDQYNDKRKDSINSLICLFGDIKQSIFDFNRADQRYIIYADQLFNYNNRNFTRCFLSVSYRVTFEMSLFINRLLLHEDRIISNKIKHILPRYIITNCFSDRTFEEVVYYLNLGYKPDDIFILAPSINSQKTPIRELENKIKRQLRNVMVYVPTNDNEKIDKEIMRNKMIFSTFHQVKGMERKVVIVFNFDQSYYTFFKKNYNNYHCSNELYVAVTRASEQLTLFHHYKNEYFLFIDRNELSKYAYLENDVKYLPENVINYKNVSTSVTDICKFLSHTIIDTCYNYLQITKEESFSKEVLTILSKITNNMTNTSEFVHEITGIAIPSFFQLKKTGKISILDELSKSNCEIHLSKKQRGEIDEIQYLRNIDINSINIKELLYLSNCWNTLKHGYLFKLYQISNYSWLTEDQLNICVNRLNRLNISESSHFEVNVVIENEPELLNRKLIGYIDCYDYEKNIVYEFKCVQKLEKEHFIQLAIYMYMNEITNLRKNQKRNKPKELKMKQNENYTIGDTIHFYNESDVLIKGIVKYIYRTTDKIKVINLCDENDKQLNIKHLKIDRCKILKNNHHEYSMKPIIDNKDDNKVIMKYVLFNILTNEYYNVTCDIDSLKNMIQYLVLSRFTTQQIISDDEFIELNKKIYEKIVKKC